MFRQPGKLLSTGYIQLLIGDAPAKNVPEIFSFTAFLETQRIILFLTLHTNLHTSGNYLCIYLLLGSRASFHWDYLENYVFFKMWILDLNLLSVFIGEI